MKKILTTVFIFVLCLSLTSCNDSASLQYIDSEGNKVKYVFEETYDKEQIYKGLDVINIYESKSKNKNVKVNGSLNLDSTLLNMDFYLETTKSNYTSNKIQDLDFYLEYNLKYATSQYGYTVGDYSSTITDIDSKGSMYYENNVYLSMDGSYKYSKFFQHYEKSFSKKYKMTLEYIFKNIEDIIDKDSNQDNDLMDSKYNNQVLDFIYEYCLSIKKVNKKILLSHLHILYLKLMNHMVIVKYT